MNKLIASLLSAMVIVACLQTRQPGFEQNAQSNLIQRLDTLSAILALTDAATDAAKLQTIFIQSRACYKQIEPFVEYYYQGLSRRINGPALPELKTDDHMVSDASGFQVLEELIYSDSIDVDELRKQVKILITDLLFVKNSIRDMPIQDHHLYELLQHQIIRIATLGITGFDSPVSFQSVHEAGHALTGIAA
jgi:cytochrome c peroxidase